MDRNTNRRLLNDYGREVLSQLAVGVEKYPRSTVVCGIPVGIGASVKSIAISVEPEEVPGTEVDEELVIMS